MSIASFEQKSLYVTGSLFEEFKKEKEFKTLQTRCVRVAKGIEEPNKKVTLKYSFQ